jgi:hypothetical protein
VSPVEGDGDLARVKLLRGGAGGCRSVAKRAAVGTGLRAEGK